MRELAFGIIIGFGATGPMGRLGARVVEKAAGGPESSLRRSHAAEASATGRRTPRPDRVDSGSGSPLRTQPVSSST